MAKDKSTFHWICDKCKKPIHAADQGWLEWHDDSAGRACNFKIVHHSSYSPLKNAEGCYFHGNQVTRQDCHLDEFVGPDGLVAILSKLDAGIHIDPKRKGKGVADTREFAELIRRLHVPHYDEARPLMANADSMLWPADFNELSVYSQKTLKQLIAGEFSREGE